MKLNRRYKRNFKENRSFYIVVSLLTVLVGMLAVSAISTSMLMKRVYHAAIDDCHTEDAQFVTLVPVSDNEISDAEEKYDLTLERMLYVDEELDGSKLRVFAQTDKVNTYLVTGGDDIAADDEMLISEQYANAHDLKIGDQVAAAGQQYKIVGFMVRADYLAMLKETTDSFANYEKFGMAIIKKNAVEEAEEHNEYYSVRYSADSSVAFRRDLNEDHHILSYTASDGNMRINSALNQSKLIFSIALVVVPVLYIIVLLLISLMLKRRLKSEQRQIGTLVALGYRKGEIFRHYSIYAIIPAVVGGVIGVIGGYFATFPFSAFYFGYFESVPYTVKADIVTVIVILAAPLLLYTLVAYFTVSKVLKKAPVEMLRQTEKSSGRSSRALVGKDISFKTKYRIRSIVMHKSRSAVIIVGMIISTVCVLIGWCMLSLNLSPSP